MQPRRLLTAPNLLGTAAVFLAVTGSAVAGAQLGKNSVKTRHLAPNAVTSAKVKNGTLKPRDFAATALPRPAAGPPGDRGAAGAQGARGPQGPAGATPFQAGARVKADGSAAIASPPGAVTATRTGLGIYRLDFAENLDLCAFVVTLTIFSGGSSGDPVPPGMTAGRISGNSLRVEIRDVAGAYADRDFETGVAC
jgi:hypothetical protein